MRNTVPGRRRSTATASLAALSALTLSLAACSGGSLSAADAGGDGEGDGLGTVKVGLAIPASGVYQPLGDDMQQGFDLYLDQHDGKLGGADVEVVVADEGEGPDTGVPAVNKLITQDQVGAIVGLVNSATALGVKDAVEQAQIPLLIANAGADQLTDGSDYIWRTSFTNGAVGAALGPAVAEAVDGPVYVMAADYAAGHESAAGFIEAFTAAGGEIAGESYTPFGSTSDWQPYLSQVQSSGASALYVFYAGAEAVNFVTQYDAFGLHDEVPLYGAGFLTEGGVLDAQGDAAVGVHTSLHYSDQIDSPENAEFVAAYRDAYDEAPTVYAVQAYDAAQVLDLAIAEAGSIDSTAIAEALGSVGEIASPRGGWTFDDLHNPSQTYFLREVQDVDGATVNAVQGDLG